MNMHSHQYAHILPESEYWRAYKRIVSKSESEIPTLHLAWGANIVVPSGRPDNSLQIQYTQSCKFAPTFNFSFSHREKLESLVMICTKIRCTTHDQTWFLHTTIVEACRNPLNLNSNTASNCHVSTSRPLSWAARRVEVSSIPG